MEQTKKKYIKYGNKLMIITYGLSTTNHTYFSITGSIGEKIRGRYSDYIEDQKGSKYELIMCGAIHEEIAKKAPSLQPFIDLHLSDINGVPMYAVENGWFYKNERSFETFKSYLRLTQEEAEYGVKIDTKEAFAGWIEQFKPRWKAEADAAIQLLNN